jgi:hypothetical protein
VQGPVECAGVPRDLGVAQGMDLAWPIRSELGSSRLVDFFWKRLSPQLARLDRDLWRHHPQLAERMRGLVVASGASRRGLLESLLRAGSAPGGGSAAGVPRDGASPLLVRTFPTQREADTPALRIDRPDAGIAALVAAPAWLPTSVCGVNDSGLAVAVSEPEAPPTESERFFAPPFLLVGDCLQRFSTVEGALRWCERRPSGGAARIVAADAEGALAGVHLHGGEATRIEPVDGVLAGSQGAAGEALAKACREARAADAEELARVVSQTTSDALTLVLDPATRTLATSGGATAPARVQLERN